MPTRTPATLPLKPKALLMLLMLPLLAVGILVGTESAYLLLGIGGALIANSTGAGGGVLFIPVFQRLALSPEAAVATSFAIQCFGMTTGALAWWRYARLQRRQEAALSWQPLPKLVLLLTPISWLGLALAHQLTPPASLEHSFALFSILLGSALLALARQVKVAATALQPWHWPLLMVTALIGGVITAWLSVGVGELLVLLLIALRIDVRVAVACGVMVSAATVWPGMLFSPPGSIAWPVVYLAGPGAILGAWLARRLASALPALALKRFFAAWILLTGLLTL
ncbi:sulfite exporter TauE/SafE family protein [Ferrimonas gelatinilytica]|uniref:Probable membrane transporter protein n=1 Tax=Ferrimonas gelatinilytica TaxID=1255257 RepID=A0ABP9S6U9_9GAMM